MIHDGWHRLPVELGRPVSPHPDLVDDAVRAVDELPVIGRAPDVVTPQPGGDLDEVSVR